MKAPITVGTILAMILYFAHEGTIVPYKRKEDAEAAPLESPLDAGLNRALQALLTGILYARASDSIGIADKVLVHVVRG